MEVVQDNNTPTNTFRLSKPLLLFLHIDCYFGSLLTTAKQDDMKSTGRTSEYTYIIYDDAAQKSMQ